MIKIVYWACSGSRPTVIEFGEVKWVILVAEWKKELTEKKAAGFFFCH